MRRTQRRQASLPGDHRALEPPDSIPNSVVKRCIADGSVGSPHVRVGHRQALIPTPRSAMVGAFYVGGGRYSHMGRPAFLRVGPRDAGPPHVTDPVPQERGGGAEEAPQASPMKRGRPSRRDSQHGWLPVVGHRQALIPAPRSAAYSPLSNNVVMKRASTS